MKNKTEPSTGTFPLFEALNAKNWKLALSLINKNVNINATPIEGKDSGKSPLWLAANNKQWGLVRKLINKKADVNIKPTRGTNAGKSVLWLAIHYANWEIAELLISSGADVNATPTGKIYRGKSPLWLAISGRSETLTATLINNGADVNATATYNQDNNKSVLWLAIQKEMWGIAKVLIKRGANINTNPSCLQYTGKTCISMCINAHKINIIKTALHSSCTENRFETAIILLTKHNKNSFIFKMVVTELLSIPHTQHQIARPPYIETSIDETAINDFYANIQYSRTSTIDQDLRESDRSFKTTMHGLFYDEINRLMVMFGEMAQNVDTQTSFQKFTSIINNPSYFNRDEQAFYATIKQYLEEIYYMLANNKVSTEQKNQTLKTMSRQLMVCGAGIFNSILDIRKSFDDGDLILWLAKYRKEIIENAAATFMVKHKTLESLSIHVDAKFLICAEKEGFAPHGGAIQQQHGDIFINHKSIELESEHMQKHIISDYTLEKIINKITYESKQYLGNLSTGWIDYNKYQQISEYILQFAQQHGLTNEHQELYHGILQFSDDYLKCRINYETIDYYLVQTMRRMNILDINITEFTNENGDTLLYSTNHDCLLVWQKSKDGEIMQCDDKSEAIEQILDYEISQNKISAGTTLQWLLNIISTRLDNPKFIRQLVEINNSKKIFAAEDIVNNISALIVDAEIAEPDPRPKKKVKYRL